MSATWFDGVTVTVEIGFASDPLATTITWTDVTDYVREITVDRGRTSEFDEMQAGRAQVVLDNRDRRFDPLHSGGAYYPNVLPNKAVRIRATYATVTYDLWYGYVDRWTQDYQPPNDAVCVLEATDGFRLLQSEQLPESVWAHTIANTTPGYLWGWWRLNESNGTIAYDSSGNERHGTIYGSPSTTTGLLYGSSDGAFQFDGVDDYIEIPFAPSSYPVTVMLLWRPSVTHASALTDQEAGELVSCGASVSDGVFVGPAWDVWYGVSTDTPTDDSINVWSYAPGGDTNMLDAYPIFTTTDPILVIATIPLTASSTMRLTYDTTDATTSTSYALSGAPPPPVRIGAMAGLDSIWFGEGVFDEVVIFTADMQSQFDTYYSVAFTPYDGDTTSARIDRILNRVGWPSGLRTLGTGITTLGPAALNSAWALDYLRDVTRTEDGLLFMGVDGKVVFRNRHWRLTDSAATTSAATFSDTAGSSYPYRDLELDGYSVQWIRNRVVARRVGGASEVSAQDTTSQTAYGRITDDLGTTLHQTDVEVENLVQWRLGQRKDPKLRITRLTVAPRKAPTTLFPQVLARDIGERITVSRTPQGVGSAISQASWIEGISHRITPNGEWSTAWTLSPADPQTYLVLNDATLGQLDSNALAY